MTTNNLFTLIFPENWKETTVYTFEGPNDSGVQHNLILTIDKFSDKNIDLKSYVKGHLEDIRISMPGFEMVSETEMSVAFSPAYVIVYKYIPAENMVYFQKQYYIKKESGIYIFTSTFSKKTLKTISADIDQIVQSLVTYDEREIAEIHQNQMQM